MSDPNQDRNINRMSWIAFALAAIVGLLSIIYVRPVPAQDEPSFQSSKLQGASNA
jgi:hypothetical protein